MTTDDTSSEGAGAEPTAGATDAAALESTIWSEVDRALSGVTAAPEASVLDLIVHIPREEIVRGLRALRNDAALQFDYLRCLTAIDWEERGMEVVYHLYSIEKRHNLTVKAALPPHDLTLDSVTPVWRGANWYEREVAEMFGVRFNGHPDPRPLLMPEDMGDTFPLRKDHPLQEIRVLQGEGMAYPEDQP